MNLIEFNRVDHHPQPPQEEEQDPQQTTLKNTVEFTHNRKSFRMEKNKKHLRIIGNGNRVVISCNTGQVDVVGDNTTVWITRNAGPVRFTGHHGRIFLGALSEARLVDYEGTDGRLTVLDETEMQDRCDRNRHSEMEGIQKKKKKKKEKHIGIKKEEFVIKEVIVKKDFIFPVRICSEVEEKKSRCTLLHVTSELRIRTEF